MNSLITFYDETSSLVDEGKGIDSLSDFGKAFSALSRKIFRNKLTRVNWMSRQ